MRFVLLENYEIFCMSLNNSFSLLRLARGAVVQLIEHSAFCQEAMGSIAAVDALLPIGSVSVKVM